MVVLLRETGMWGMKVMEVVERDAGHTAYGA
jgi:hypothetical protein